MPDESGRETNDDCRDLFANCPESRTANIVLDYANNNARWHQDFGPAFQIFLKHGYPDGHLATLQHQLDGQLNKISVAQPVPDSLLVSCVTFAASSHAFVFICEKSSGKAEKHFHAWHPDTCTR